MKPGKLAFAAIIALASLAPAHAKEHELHLFVEPEGYLAFGEQDEFVFWDGSKNSDGMVSKLEWQERNVKLYGGRAGFSFDRLGAQFQILSAIRGESGEMYDSDWLNYDTVKTHYSVSTNTLESSFQLSFLAYFDFHPIRGYERFSLAPTAEFAYKNLLFSAENKEGWYGKLYDDGNYSAWNSADATHYPNQHAVLCGVDYEKLSFSSFLGARAKLDLCGERLHLGLGIAASPYTYVKAEDKHYKDLERKEFEFYTDFIHVFFKTFKGNFSTFFDINDILSLGLTGEALVSIPSRGIMNQYDRASSSWKNYEDTGGGASEYNFQIGLGIRVNLF